MSIPVTDEMVEAGTKAFMDGPVGFWRDRFRFAIVAVLAVAPRPEPSGNPGELRDAIRSAVLKEREACADTALAVAANDYLVSDGEAGRMGFRAGCKEIASAIRSRSALPVKEAAK